MREDNVDPRIAALLVEHDAKMRALWAETSTGLGAIAEVLRKSHQPIDLLVAAGAKAGRVAALLTAAAQHDSHHTEAVHPTDPGTGEARRVSGRSVASIIRNIRQV